MPESRPRLRRGPLLVGGGLLAVLLVTSIASAQKPAPLGAGRPDNADADFSPTDPMLPKTAAEEAKAFVLPPGYRMELVLSEPDVISPAVLEFDGNGRMY